MLCWPSIISSIWSWSAAMAALSRSSSRAASSERSCSGATVVSCSTTTP